MKGSLKQPLQLLGASCRGRPRLQAAGRSSSSVGHSGHCAHAGHSGHSGHKRGASRSEHSRQRLWPLSHWITSPWSGNSSCSKQTVHTRVSAIGAARRMTRAKQKKNTVSSCVSTSLKETILFHRNCGKLIKCPITSMMNG